MLLAILVFAIDIGQAILTIAKYIGAVVVILAFLFNKLSPLRKMLSWLWRKNVTQPATALITSTVQTAAAPVIAKEAAITRRASLEQHEAQNRKMDEQNVKIDDQFEAVNRRLDAGGHRMDRITQRFDAFETRDEGNSRRVDETEKEG